MARWKIAVLATGVLAAAAYLGSTWWIGSQVEAIMAENDKRLETQIPFLKVVDRKFERGFFRSTETDKISLRVFGREFAQLTLKSTIRNGPLAGLSGLATAVIDSELRVSDGYQQEIANWLAASPLLTAHTTYPLNGADGDALVTMLASNSTRLAWNGLTLKLQFSSDLAHVTMQGDVPSVEITDEKGSTLKVTGIHWDNDQKQVFADEPALYSGQQKLTIAQIDASPNAQAFGALAPPAFSMKGIEMTGGATLVANEFLDYTLKSSAKTLEINAQNYAPAHLQVSVTHVHARALAASMKAAREAWDRPLQPATPQPIAGSQQELFKHGMEIHVDRLSFTTPGGEATLTASLVPNEGTPVDLSDKTAVARAVNMRLKVSVPEEFVHGIQRKFEPAARTDEQLAAERQTLISRGLVVRNGAMLETAFEQKNGQMLVNGNAPQQNPFAQLQPAGSGDTTGNTTGTPAQLSQILNCAACHDENRRVVGPSWSEIASRYRWTKVFNYAGHSYPLVEGLVMKVSHGGAGNWGSMPMPAIDPTGNRHTDITAVVNYVLGFAGSADAPVPQPAQSRPPSGAHSISFRLGESLPQFMSELGDPASVGATVNAHARSADHEMTMISFPAHGITVFFRNDNNVLETIRYDAPYAGKIRGIGIGDNLGMLTAALGSPSPPPWDFAGARAYLFRNGANSTRYDVANGTVRTIFVLDK